MTTNPKKKRALVICPGRGTYNKTEWQALSQNFSKGHSRLETINRLRKNLSLPTISELDQKIPFDPNLHTLATHSAALIYANSDLDFHHIDRDRFDILAITGNSMGWYLALSHGEVLGLEHAFELVQGMADMMKDRIIGGQMVYPVTDEQWREDPDLFHKVNELREKHSVHTSIKYGGYLVMGGEMENLNRLKAALPPQGQFPMMLKNHGAFHTPLCEGISKRAKELFARREYKRPKVDLIDGRGKIYTSSSADPEEIKDYTLSHQVTKPYDFSLAIEMGVKEYNPDCLILTGPGQTLGGAVGQILAKMRWQGIEDKESFLHRQKEDPIVLSMGREDQRKKVIKKTQ